MTVNSEYISSGGVGSNSGLGIGMMQKGSISTGMGMMGNSKKLT